MIDGRLTYRELRPKAELRKFVLCYWEFMASQDVEEPFVHHVMPDGCVSIVKPPGEFLVVIGPRLDELQVLVRPQSTIRGIRFWPGATRALLAIPGKQLRDVFGFVEEVLEQIPQDVAKDLQLAPSLEDFASLISESLSTSARQAGDLDRVVSLSVAEIMAADGRVSIAKIADRVGLSERQFQRRFRHEVGLTPKQFARIRRFRSSVQTMLDGKSGGWSEVALVHGFADQAHLCREYADLVGLSPEELRLRVQSIDHVNVEA